MAQNIGSFHVDVGMADGVMANNSGRPRGFNRSTIAAKAIEVIDQNAGLVSRIENVRNIIVGGQLWIHAASRHLGRAH